MITLMKHRNHRNNANVVLAYAVFYLRFFVNFCSVVPESPREIFVKLMDSHSVLVMWTTTKQQAVTSYYVEYRLMNSDGVQLKVLQNQNKTSLTGLQSHAVYEVRVRAVNGAGGGIWSNYQTFSTGQTCKP